MKASTAAPRLGLAAHVHACEVHGQVILFDLRAGKYLAVSQSSSLADHVEGWPGSTAATRRRPAPASVTALARPLVAMGLLTDVTSEWRPRTTIEEPTSSLDRDPGLAGAGISARRVCRFVQSSALTALWLRCRSLQAIAIAVQERRARSQALASDVGTPDALPGSTAAYERLRPFAFTAHRHCLYDSLALVGYLALEGLFPRWVIGVQTRPFGAHSWVQSGATVLNDEPERVRRFRPILVV